MEAAFIYLAIGALIMGLLAGCDIDNPVGYAVAIFLWPFLAITVAAAMIRDAILQGKA